MSGLFRTKDIHRPHAVAGVALRIPR